MKSGSAFFFLLMLWAHLGHVFEEVWGRFWILPKVGLAGFLAINWALFLIPLTLLLFILNGKRRAFQLGLVYAGFMGLQGIGHNIGTLVTGRYFGGFAGGFTGILMFLIAWPLIYALRKEMPDHKAPGRKN
jgi:hypothetical protein